MSYHTAALQSLHRLTTGVLFIFVYRRQKTAMLSHGELANPCAGRLGCLIAGRGVVVLLGLGMLEYARLCFGVQSTEQVGDREVRIPRRAIPSAALSRSRAAKTAFRTAASMMLCCSARKISSAAAGKSMPCCNRSTAGGICSPEVRKLCSFERFGAQRVSLVRSRRKQANGVVAQMHRNLLSESRASANPCFSSI